MSAPTDQQIGEMIRLSGELENALSRVFHVQGRSLHEKITAAENRLPPGAIKQMRFVASVRNAVAHGNATNVDTAKYQNYVSCAKESLHVIQSFAPNVAASNVSFSAIMITLSAIVAIVILAYSIHK